MSYKAIIIVLCSVVLIRAAEVTPSLSNATIWYPPTFSPAAITPIKSGDSIIISTELVSDNRVNPISYIVYTLTTHFEKSTTYYDADEPLPANACEAVNAIGMSNPSDYHLPVYRRIDGHSGKTVALTQRTRIRAMGCGEHGQSHTAEASATYMIQATPIIDPCATSVSKCKNGGTCMAVNGTVTCLCASGFTGEFCQTAGDPCASSPCRNGGTCVVSAVHTDEHDVKPYACTCAKNFFGGECQIGFPAPTFSPASGVPIRPNAHISIYTSWHVFDSLVHIDDDELPEVTHIVYSTQPDTVPPHCDYEPLIGLAFNSTAPVSPLHLIHGHEGVSIALTPGAGGVHALSAIACGKNGAQSEITKAEYVFDVCASRPCKNGATCMGSETNFTCVCPPYFTGIKCASFDRHAYNTTGRRPDPHPDTGSDSDAHANTKNTTRKWQSLHLQVHGEVDDFDAFKTNFTSYLVKTLKPRFPNVTRDWIEIYRFVQTGGAAGAGGAQGAGKKHPLYTHSRARVFSESDGTTDLTVEYAIQPTEGVTADAVSTDVVAHFQSLSARQEPLVLGEQSFIVSQGNDVILVQCEDGTYRNSCSSAYGSDTNTTSDREDVPWLTVALAGVGGIFVVGIACAIIYRCCRMQQEKARVPAYSQVHAVGSLERPNTTIVHEDPAALRRRSSMTLKTGSQV